MRLLWFLFVALWLVALPSRAQGDSKEAQTTAPAEEDKSAYERHMDNGWKLYHEQNYPGAIAEFNAAYQAEAKASPLINLALTYKKLFEYPKAIEALERALAKHEDTMKPEHREAAEREIRELRGLLAYVNVKVTPRDAKLFIDNEAFDGPRGRPIALSPGSHRFRAEAEGYKPNEVARTLTSGNGNSAVELDLELVTGKLNVATLHPNTLIEVDGKQVAMGKWSGLLPPGVHAVRVLHDTDEEAVLNVFVRAGGRHHVTQEEDGTLKSDSPALKQRDKASEEPEVRRGFYGTGGGSLLTAFPIVKEFTPDSQGGNRWGAAAALHLGYRVAEWAAFEVFGQFSDIRITGKVDLSPNDADPTSAIPTKLVLQSGRVGGLIRVMYPPRTMFRAIATIGAGVLVERAEWRAGEDGEAAPPLPPKAEGVGAFGQIDIGLEIEVSNVLIDVVTQNIIQGTKHLEVAGVNPFDDKPMLVFGPQLRVGYGIW
ncbi:MAG TPA: hypothetical protein VFB62_17575 [Polyangiaceae bacterium]|jgi:hypothetical protein|nr:hypothetical protein [Polyangiaceae bacterium]